MSGIRALLGSPLRGAPIVGTKGPTPRGRKIVEKVLADIPLSWYTQVEAREQGEDTMTTETTIKDDAKYVVIDCQTGEVVYTTTWKNRKKARSFADKKDMEYGAVRYSAKLA